MRAFVFFKKNSGMFAACFTLVLIIVALMGKILLREYAPLSIDEGILAGKTVPCTLTPPLMIGLLAAFFIDRGYFKAVGIGGAVLLAASTMVEMGCAIWLATGEDWIYVTLHNYSVRLPFACLLIATALRTAGAIAVTLSLLSLARNSESTLKETGLFSAVAVGSSAAVVLSVVFLSRMDIQWSHIAAALFLYVLLWILLLLYYLSQDVNGKCRKPVDATEKEKMGKQAFLWFSVIVLCTATTLSFWLYVRERYLAGYRGHWLENYLSMSMSLLILAFCFLLTWNRPRNAKRAMTGSALLFAGTPLIPACFNVTLVELVPQAVVGIGLAMVLKSALIPFLQVPTRRYATLWVMTGILVTAIGKAMVIAFNRMEDISPTVAISPYTVYPLLFLGLFLLTYLAAKKEKTLPVTTDN